MENPDIYVVDAPVTIAPIKLELKQDNNEDQRIETSWKRWYVMILFALTNFVSMMTLNSFSPIASSLKAVFGWDTAVIASLSLVNWIMLLAFILPAGWFVNRFGIRTYTVASSFIVSIGLILRCIPASKEYNYQTAIQIQNTLASIACAGAFVVPPVITFQWFPLREWRVATAIGIFLQFLGASVAFKLEPAVIPDPSAGYSISVIKERIYYYSYSLTAVSFAIAIWNLFLFPAKPELPPSNVAADSNQEDTTDSRSIYDDILGLVLNWRFWALVIRTMLLGAMSKAVEGLLFPFLEGMGISQDYAGTMGFVQSLVSIPVAMIVGKLGDLSHNNLKSIIIACTILALEGAIWLFLISKNILPSRNRSIFYATLLYTVFGGCPLGLDIELGCDCLYPIPEAYVASGIIFFSTSIGVIFSGLLMDPNLSSQSINWVILCTAAVGTLCAFFLPANYARSNAEKTTLVKQNDNS